MRLTMPSPGSQLALVQLPRRMRRALGLFRKITGLNAVASLATSLPEPQAPFVLSPPVHPRCARKLRAIPNAPCGEQWLIHVRTSRRSSRTHGHICPIGLRCSCVPIHFGDQLVGVAKLVVDADTPERILETALSVLKVVVSETCQESAVMLLSEEVQALRERLTELQQVHANDRGHADASSASSLATAVTGPDFQGAALIDRALDHLRRHFQDSTLSLHSVAAALHCNPRYLTSRFTLIVGERMHAYLIALRVSHACRLLMDTDSSIKSVAHASGFSGPGRLAGAFRRHVGVAPGDYRRIFSAP